MRPNQGANRGAGSGGQRAAVVSAGPAAPVLGPGAAFPVVCLSCGRLAAVWAAGYAHAPSAPFPALRALRGVCWTGGGGGAGRGQVAITVSSLWNQEASGCQVTGGRWPPTQRLQAAEVPSQCPGLRATFGAPHAFSGGDPLALSGPGGRTTAWGAPGLRPWETRVARTGRCWRSCPEALGPPHPHPGAQQGTRGAAAGWGQSPQVLQEEVPPPAFHPGDKNKFAKSAANLVAR